MSVVLMVSALGEELGKRGEVELPALGSGEGICAGYSSISEVFCVVLDCCSKESIIAK